MITGSFEIRRTVSQEGTGWVKGFSHELKFSDNKNKGEMLGSRPLGPILLLPPHQADTSHRAGECQAEGKGTHLGPDAPLGAAVPAAHPGTVEDTRQANPVLAAVLSEKFTESRNRRPEQR